MKVNLKLLIIFTLLLGGAVTVQALEPIGDPPPVFDLEFTLDVYSELEDANGDRTPFPTSWNAQFHVNMQDGIYLDQHGFFASTTANGVATTSFSATMIKENSEYPADSSTDFHLDSVSVPYGYRLKYSELIGKDFICIDSGPVEDSSTASPPYILKIDWGCSAEVALVYEQIPGVTFEVVSTDPEISYTITPIGAPVPPQSSSTSPTANLHHFPTNGGSYTFRITVASQAGYVNRVFESTKGRPINPSSIATTLSLPIGSKETIYITRERVNMTQTLQATNLTTGQTVEATTETGTCLIDCEDDPSVVTLPSSPGDQINLVWSSTNANSCVGSWTEPPYQNVGLSGNTTVVIPGGGEGLTGRGGGIGLGVGVGDGGGSGTTTDLVSFIFRCTQNPIKGGRLIIGE